MPDITGRLRPPRLAGAPASPAFGELYFDTGTNTLYWWSGTAWVSASGGGGGPAIGASTYGKLAISAYWTIPANFTSYQVPLDTAVYNVGGYVTASSHIYTCPNTGYYMACGLCAFTSPWSTVDAVQIWLSKNGALNSFNPELGSYMVGDRVAQFSGPISCNAGDTLALALNSTASTMPQVSNYGTYLAIYQI